MTEDEMVGWHHQLKGHEFEQAPGDGEGQGYGFVQNFRSRTLIINSYILIVQFSSVQFLSRV